MALFERYGRKFEQFNEPLLEFVRTHPDASLKEIEAQFFEISEKLIHRPGPDPDGHPDYYESEVESVFCSFKEVEALEYIDSISEYIVLIKIRHNLERLVKEYIPTLPMNSDGKVRKWATCEFTDDDIDGDIIPRPPDSPEYVPFVVETALANQRDIKILLLVTKSLDESVRTIPIQFNPKYVDECYCPGVNHRVCWEYDSRHGSECENYKCSYEGCIKIHESELDNDYSGFYCEDIKEI